MVSYILCENKFIEFFNKIIANLGIKNKEYISAVLAESLVLFEPEIRDKYALLVDVGYITTSVAVVRGDGLLHLSSFSLGGANISADFNMAMGIDFDKAEELKKSLELNLIPDDDELYEVVFDGEVFSVPLIDIYELAYSRLETIAEYIKLAINVCDFDCPTYVPVYLTGGGISYIRGAKEYISHIIGRPVEVVAPDVPMFSKPEYSTTIGLLDAALRNNKKLGLIDIVKLKLGGIL